ncbi:oxygenase MpaB family protein [Roseivirga sp.]|uniref:oxygenase MpaB family protein n=1 Tax=Roseivirga sp. TaxID=1964215 RepID=UPI003B51C653
MSVMAPEMEVSESEYFVNQGSIVRQIWGKSDTILFIFAGAAAEFALSKAVDWLYFTGRLPSDPLGRLFSTVNYAKRIVFSRRKEAYQAIDSITTIHGSVEAKRGYQIPDWAYRDVLFMLIDYSIRAYELLERPLTHAEYEEVLRVFNQLGERMQIPNLPHDFSAWQTMREDHLLKHLAFSDYTADLFQQYRKHLGVVRYRMLLDLQAFVVPPRVRELMGFKRKTLLRLMIHGYKLSRIIRLDGFIKSLVLPSVYKQQIKALDES